MSNRTDSTLTARSLSQNQRDALEVYRTKLELELKGKLKELDQAGSKKETEITAQSTQLEEAIVADAHTTIPEAFKAAVSNLNTLGLDLIISLHQKESVRRLIQRTKDTGTVMEFVVSAYPRGKEGPTDKFYASKDQDEEDDDRNPSEVEDEMWEESYWNVHSDSMIDAPGFMVKFRKEPIGDGSKGLAAISIPHNYKLPESFLTQLKHLVALEAELKTLRVNQSQVYFQLRDLPKQERLLLAALAEENLQSTPEGRAMLAQIAGTAATELRAS